MKCKLLIIALLVLCPVKGFTQKVTISEKDVSLEKIMNLIRKQTGCYFISDGIICPQRNACQSVVKDKPVKEALDILFSKLSLHAPSLTK